MIGYTHSQPVGDRIRPHPKSVTESRSESDNDVVIVDESSNPESPRPAGGSGNNQASSGASSPPYVTTTGLVRYIANATASTPLLSRMLMAGASPSNSPMVSPVASPQPAPLTRGTTRTFLETVSHQSTVNDPRRARQGGPTPETVSTFDQTQTYRSTTTLLPQHPLRPLASPRTDPTVPPGFKEHNFNLVGNRYLLLDHLEGSHLQRCINVQNNQEFVCKTVRNDTIGQSMLSAHMRVDGHPHINPVHEVLVAETATYLVFPPCHVDLHSYVRTKRRLREPQARALFRQIVSAVHGAHSKGIVLRDLKLRKFVFTDETRSTLKLESLEDAVVLDDEEHDLLSDKHGCPAYVSPEILRRDAIYSGRAADMWGLGVMLYTMLVGRYPFHGQEHTGLFAKIRRGQFTIPDSISSRAKCLIRCLLRKEAEDRLTTEDVLVHPWINLHSSSSGFSSIATSTSLLSASSLSSSSHRSSERSSRHHRGSSSLGSASNQMSVAPASVYLPQSQANASLSLHPTLISGAMGAVVAAVAAMPTHHHTFAASSSATASAMSNPGFADNLPDQTVPESFHIDEQPAAGVEDKN